MKNINWHLSLLCLIPSHRKNQPIFLLPFDPTEWLGCNNNAGLETKKCLSLSPPMPAEAIGSLPLLLPTRNTTFTAAFIGCRHHLRSKRRMRTNSSICTLIPYHRQIPKYLQEREIRVSEVIVCVDWFLNKWLLWSLKLPHCVFANRRDFACQFEENRAELLCHCVQKEAKSNKWILMPLKSYGHACSIRH